MFEKNYNEIIQSEEYSFLRDNPHLGKNIILLILGGSHAYGTATEGSDLDVRGCTLNTKMEILTNERFDVFTNKKTDTVIYAFNQLVALLSNSNPNVIEMLGCKPEHYLYLHPIGQELLDNKDIFLSKKAYYSFAGYATAQLRRLTNKSARQVGQTEREQHILGSIRNASYTFPEKYFQYPEDAIRLYVDKSEREEYDSEIFMDVNLTHYPLRDYKGMWAEMNTIVKEYAKVGKRNNHAMEHGKLGKHMQHLIRLYLMCLDILEDGKIVTYREKERDFLMDIRNGKYLDKDNQPVPEFFDMVDEYEQKLEHAKEHSPLPEKPNYEKIKEFTASVNERVVRGEA